MYRHGGVQRARNDCGKFERRGKFTQAVSLEEVETTFIAMCFRNFISAAGRKRRKEIDPMEGCLENKGAGSAANNLG